MLLESILYAGYVHPSRIYTMGPMRNSSSNTAIDVKVSGEDVLNTKAPVVYTTGDKISGEISLSAAQDLPFDEISITFEGNTRTWAERYNAAPSANSRVNSSHTFLKLTQPIHESHYPTPRKIARGQPFIIPFTFVIPSELLPSACHHYIENNTVGARHLCLPPSLGDRAVVSDLAPDNTKISYCIRARLLRCRSAKDAPVCLIENTRMVRIMPAVEDEPPVHVRVIDPDFILRKEKDITKGYILSRKLGKLVVAAEQPKPLHLSLTNRCPPTTAVMVALKFTPTEENIEPPRLGTLSAKLKTNTFYSTNFLPFRPTPSRTGLGGMTGGGNSSDTVLLSSRSMAAASWQSSLESARKIYTLSLPLPVATPKGRTLVPTFESCLASRSYVLFVSVTLLGGPIEKTITLRVPLQVSSPPAVNVSDEQSAQGVEEPFPPRSVASPEETLQPPGYSPLFATRGERMAGISPAG